MSIGCVHGCHCVNCEKVESTGWRNTFYYPGGGSYNGCWYKSRQNYYGMKRNKYKLQYDGEFSHNQRHGYGTFSKPQTDGVALERSYIGSWHRDLRAGEGKQFYKEGVYFGWWRENCRDGLGIMWFKNGAMYVGEWRADLKHGVGVYYLENGNRYEGHFARGMKNGEGTFYHVHTGQIQKGMWENDICKTSMMIDVYRQQATRPTEYPIPKSGLHDPDGFVREIFQKYMSNAFISERPYKEKNDLNFINKIKKYVIYEPKMLLKTTIPYNDIKYPCVCKKREKCMRLDRVECFD